jgi:Flp pilus assembly protein TadD
MAFSPVASPQQGSAEPTPPARASWKAADNTDVSSENASVAQASVLFSEALRHHQRGQRGVAITLYKELIFLDPNLPEVHCNLGAALAELGRFDEAVSSLRRAITLNPTAS